MTAAFIAIEEFPRVKPTAHGRLKNPEALYRFTWGNNAKRAAMKGRTCRVLCRGKLNSALIEFVDNGQIEVISRTALRRTAA